MTATVVAAAALSAEGKELEAAEAFRVLAAEAQDGYALLARFRTVDALKESGDIAGAVKSWMPSQPTTVSMSSIAIWRLC